jgi:hypothetical protein
MPGPRHRGFRRIRPRESRGPRARDVRRQASSDARGATDGSAGPSRSAVPEASGSARGGARMSATMTAPTPPTTCPDRDSCRRLKLRMFSKRARSSGVRLLPRARRHRHGRHDREALRPHGEIYIRIVAALDGHRLGCSGLRVEHLPRTPPRIARHDAEASARGLHGFPPWGATCGQGPSGISTRLSPVITRTRRSTGDEAVGSEPR